MSDYLTLPLKAEYFDAIKAGTKPEEYRVRNPYWKRRIEDRAPFSGLRLTRGYPRKGDSARWLYLPWRGYVVKTIIHPHFGGMEVEVYAIDVRQDKHAGDEGSPK
jgi:hypothetical protein